MPKLSRIAVLSDTIAALGSIFLLSYRWFQSRQIGFRSSLLLAGCLAILLLYAFLLRRKSRQIKDLSKIRRRSAVYTLSMLEHAQALRYASEALANRYKLILPERNAHNGLFTAFDQTGRRLAIGLLHTPQADDIGILHEFHRKRSGVPGVLIYTTAPSEHVRNYAQTLYPALRLVSAESLPLDKSLENRFTMPGPIKKQRLAVALLHTGAGHAMRCMLYSFGMIVLYLITFERSILYPALALSFLSVILKERKESDVLFRA